ncbi:MAG TPA: alpha-amylase family glycosyl hydrolase [Thermotogota bacterium]|nr:alpha-amylase family glycosyl hydrolase [Thermotogota bacterium]HPJ87545.1 alpha-amylase family glycosyl hydrolase [Thermotogota bacterium]HPR94750.1 alpha-amylase family glycosyl hydrolase [Thermotogota bacterium]
MSREWWKGAVIYQIYPRSFQDSNKDGIGDLKGIISRLDYLEWLGVDALWLSPIFKSPMKDFGYDISDYLDIDPMFGTLDDFKELLEKSHEKGIKVIVDQVYNHTSDKHDWFIESESSRDNPKSDWYIWVDGKKGELPNNWFAYFGGPAWEWSETRQQYYLHLFVKEQPDLNWRNPKVVNAIMDSIKFWLDMGVDGFRFDVVNMYYKDERLRDNPKVEGRNSKIEFHNFYRVFENDRPETLLAVEKINDLVEKYDERVTIGEVGSPMGTPAYFQYSMPGRLNMAFNFEFKEITDYSAKVYRDKIKEIEKFFQSVAWPSYVLGNHDSSRYPTRFATESEKEKMIQVMATMLLTLRGTPFIYYGEELGMEDVEVPFEKMVDPEGVNFWPEAKGRDPERTPMQWDEGKNASFSDMEPWLPLAENFRENNVAKQKDNPDSILNYYRTVIHLRKASDAIKFGTIELIDIDKDILAYKRRYNDEELLIILNFSESEFEIENTNFSDYHSVLLSNYKKKKFDGKINSNEVMILRK